MPAPPRLTEAVDHHQFGTRGLGGVKDMARCGNTQALDDPGARVQTQNIRLEARCRIAALEFLGLPSSKSWIDEVDCVTREGPRSLPHGLTDQFLRSSIRQSRPQTRLLAILDVIQRSTIA